MKYRLAVVCTLYMYKIDFQIHPTLIDISTNAMSSALLFTKPCGFTSSVEPSTVPFGQFMLVTTSKTESRPIHISCDEFLVTLKIRDIENTNAFTLMRLCLFIPYLKCFTWVYNMLQNYEQWFTSFLFLKTVQKKFWLRLFIQLCASLLHSTSFKKI